MKITARLLLAGAIAAGSFGLTAPASACDQPPKCAVCKTNPLFLVNGGEPVTCYS